MFGISDSDMIDKNKVKIVDGIAGAAKSSGIDKFLTERGIVYGRYTSTNKLARDAESRYGCHCDTIAGGLFQTDDGIFFSEEKDAEYQTVVIDEILQTSPKVFNWISNNVGKINIIVTTDSRQMLTPHTGFLMAQRFEELKREPYSISVTLEKSYRPRTEKTNRYYERAFKSVDEDACVYYEDRKLFKTINASELKWNPDDVYICHTREHENFLYDEFDLYHKYECELIPKGRIARKKLNLENYPILPQARADGSASYSQLANVATPTRYQGSEVKSNQKLYFLIGSRSKIEAREWYTVVTRCWDLRSLVLVVCDLEKSEPLTEYAGAVVKSPVMADVSPDVKLPDGSILRDRFGDSKKVELTDEEFGSVVQSFKDTDTTHTVTRGFFADGRYVCRKYEAPAPGTPGSGKTSAGVSIQSLLAKDAVFDCTYLPALYRVYEKVQRLQYPGAPVVSDHIYGPSITCHGREKDVPFEDSGALKYENIIKSTEYRYQLDLHSAYPHILNNEMLPTGFRFSSRTEEFTEDPYRVKVDSPGKIDWFYLGTDDVLIGGALITGSLARLIQREGRGGQRCYYIGTSNAQRGSLTGQWLLDKAHKTAESKEDIKNIHYGWMEKPYLEPIEMDGDKVKAYTTNDYYSHELLMCAIRSSLCEIILKIKNEVYGRVDRGYTKVDALFFDTVEDIESLAHRIEAVIPGYEFRVADNQTGEILYKNYADLETKAERKNRLRREARARKKMQ